MQWAWWLLSWHYLSQPQAGTSYHSSMFIYVVVQNAWRRHDIGAPGTSLQLSTKDG